ncbi:hypothetical protein PHYBLDRAFT_64177 [Phycomyces blakesleeanus NRRL 1555(-)]|uniref:J domain-containing protein n=1 Tax=Phycomyces blakesleeanus (strain ATCC 8743b / DSM 1359 / FGSC 10004 / NBRC 33097 / NRRL 1555) TaxID=763407 RepID=A0A162TY19_PHYB8|nr:hypothetical protein PHYBLDRAFT_64177 [Phycomyces blakesleeanus NRRL 1555(-)]OAD70743.1 hypothetical protein PHYBLDRAFT_64177 [Phycomyces blakesleeanus NRRL 1555(-)]|eukprot:XP_018288783.1 hypothetical protein PHYBLDRAFT_64177 [Phycomyces blakesleeanus NRRL 1555(-)]
MAAKGIDAEVDYYDLLGIQITSTEKEITKAYRVKALAVHPDKNPSPDAGMSPYIEAYEVLKDVQAKAAYDKLYRARLDRKKKQMEMDSKRRKAQEELESRENAAKRTKTDLSEAEAQYKKELARLREEGAKRRQEDWKTEEVVPEMPETTELDCALKIKWKRKKHAFTEESIKELLNTIGKVDTIAFSEKKKGSALVVFKTVVDAHAIMTNKDTNQSLALFESIDWATGKEPAIVGRLNADYQKQQAARQAHYANDTRQTIPTGKPLFSAGSQSSFFRNISASAIKLSSNGPKLSDKDYETITLMQLRNSEREKTLRKLKEGGQ